MMTGTPSLLVERWVIRGGVMLVVMLLSAILTTYLGMAEAHTLMDKLLIAALIAAALAAAAAAFVFRITDIRIHTELRRRRS